MKIIHLNVNGLVAKKYKVIEFLNIEKPDVLALSETHLKGKDEFDVRGYEWYGVNYERAIRGSRGVGFLVKKGIKYQSIKHDTDLMEEGRSAGLQIGRTQVHIIYMPVNTES